MRIYPSDFFDDKNYDIDENLCFVIMPYGKEWSERIYKIISETVEGMNFKCRRADDYYGKIVLNDIWDQINMSSFVIADLTSNNPNVYYELGIAHTLGKEVIPILQRGHEIPFDQKPFRILFYEDNLDGYEILKQKLPRWINSLSYVSEPQMIIKNEMIEKFNEWISSKNGVQFVREDFSHLNLENIDLSESNLNECDFSKSNLSKADLNGSNLIRSDFSNSVLRNANLSSANLSEADLEEADLSESDLSDSILLRVNLSRSNLKDANVKGLTIDYNTHKKYENILQESYNYTDMIVER
jgi:hypothetical protein